LRQLVGTPQRAPLADEIEVSIFGPGFGECLVLHLAENEWIIVDSCLALNSKRPAALEYLEALGVDTAERVTFVIASHWHDDHVKGLGDLVEACPNAKFFCAHALGGEEFRSLMGLYRRDSTPGGGGISELLQIVKILESRRKKGEVVSPKFASAGTCLIDRDSPRRISLKALSPSPAACAATTIRVAQELTPEAGGVRSSIRTLEPNDLAIVLSVRVDDVRILLGADLEEIGRPGLGWDAVVQDFSAEHNNHAGFKVPHHGSENGHYQPVWETMLAGTTWAVLTPYNKGKLPLPSPEDVERITALTADAFSTARLTRVVRRHADNIVTKTLREMEVTITQEPSGQGHVRMRKKINSTDDWTVELFGDAYRLNE
jgi:beta-lactamase superfamily II metal-dependent hydrolase